MILMQKKSIEGAWKDGLVLDKHVRKSTYLGDDENGHAKFDNERSELGEAIYKLKYKQDWNQVDNIGAVLAQEVVSAGWKIDFVVPMPATTARPRQPVTEIADRMAKIIGKPMFGNVLCKRPHALNEPPIKNIGTLEEKIAALSGKMYVQDTVSDGSWNVLLVDDLYDSGASLAAAAAALNSYKNVKNVYVVCCTWTKS